MDFDKFVARPGCPRKQRYCARCEKPMLISTGKFCSTDCRNTTKRFQRKYVSVVIAKKRYLLDDLVKQYGVPRRTLIDRIRTGNVGTLAEFVRQPRIGLGSPPLLGFEKRNVRALRDAWL